MKKKFDVQNRSDARLPEHSGDASAVEGELLGGRCEIEIVCNAFTFVKSVLLFVMC